VGSRPRAIYWSKLPRLEKKIRVAIDGALDVFFAKDFVQYLDQRSAVVAGIGDPGDAEHGDTPDRPGSAIPATTEIAA
jgi:hypothetical protein